MSIGLPRTSAKKSNVPHVPLPSGFQVPKTWKKVYSFLSSREVGKNEFGDQCWITKEPPSHGLLLVKGLNRWLRVVSATEVKKIRYFRVQSPGNPPCLSQVMSVSNPRAFAFIYLDERYSPDEIWDAIQDREIWNKMHKEWKYGG